MLNTPIKRILLTSSGPAPRTRAPAALAFMAGVCESLGINYDIIDLNTQFHQYAGQDVWHEMSEHIYAANSYDSVHKVPLLLQQQFDNFCQNVSLEIKQGSFDALAITVLSFQQYHWTQSFLQQVKNICSGLTVIVGGPGVSTTHSIQNGIKINFGRYLVNNDLADCFVMGEGDILFGKFLQGRALGLPGFNIKNMPDVWQPQIDNLDATPLPSYKKISFDDYWSFEDNPVITITASRGCVRRCSFCDIGYHWKKFRFRSGPRVVEELYKNYQEMGVTNFWFNDSLLNGSYKQFFEFLESLQQKQSQDSGFKKISFGGQLILRNRTSHSEKMYQLLCETGGNFFQVGIESGSEAVRNHMGKKFSNEDIDYHYEMSEKFGIQNWIFMTVGYPTETDQDFQDTIDLYTRLQKYLINDTIVGTSVPGPILILENTPLSDMMDHLNISWIHDELSPGQWVSNSVNGLDTKTKFLRYVFLVRHILNLGYHVPPDLRHRVKLHCDYFQNLSNRPGKQLIPIKTIESSMLS